VHFLTATLVPTSAPDDWHAADAICTECSAQRMPVSQQTMHTLDAISQMFGIANEPIVFRKNTSALAEKIRQHDIYLKTNHGPDGRSWYQIIADTHNEIYRNDVEPPTDDSGLEVVD
jgi:hypothetical protein